MIKKVSVVKPSGAFYFTVTFDENLLKPTQTLPLHNLEIKAMVEEKVANVKLNQLDKRFTYYLMASYGLCVVPLSGFNSNLNGFRMTLLEEDIQLFDKTLSILTEAIPAYLGSN